MAVVMTTKFYEEDTPAWHDLSKIVFTSPNIVSPNTAGTRSHILPGKGDIALWYEDTANMYEIVPVQDTYDNSFYYYHFTVVSGIDLDSSPTLATITADNYPQFINFIKRELDVEVVGFIPVNPDIVDETLKLEYTMKIVSHPCSSSDFSLRHIYYSNAFACRCGQSYYDKSWAYYSTGWMVEVINEVPECYIEFEVLEPINITYIKMDSRYTKGCPPLPCIWYFIGNFKIQGKTTGMGADWIDLYTGSNTSNVTKDIFITSNTDYYTYYRILILDNSSLVDLPEAGNEWDKNYYAISGLVFYGYEFSTDPGTGHVVLYSFDDDVSRRELHVVNASANTGNPILEEYDTNTDVEGTITMITVSGTGGPITRYIIDVGEEGSSANYHTQAVGDSVTPVISGTTGINGTVGTTSIVEDFEAITDGYIDVTGETKIESEYVYSNLSGQQLAIAYSDNEYEILTDITYTTVISGAFSGAIDESIPVTGYTNRYEERSSSPRNAFYVTALTDTVGSGIIPAMTTLYLWKQKADLEDVEFSTHDSIVFEITQGEAYDCRLTAWDDVTHSTTLNYLISGDYVRVSALAFRAEGTVLAPESSITINNYIASPIYNRIFKGNVVYNGTNYYYGDFDLSARTEPDMIGDYLIFKPMLYGVDEAVPYGIHDHVIVLHYTYT